MRRHLCRTLSITARDGCTAVRKVACMGMRAWHAGKKGRPAAGRSAQLAKLTWVVSGERVDVEVVVDDDVEALARQVADEVNKTRVHAAVRQVGVAGARAVHGLRALPCRHGTVTARGGILCLEVLSFIPAAFLAP